MNRSKSKVTNNGGENLKKYKVGYTTGFFDLFHIGHLNILRRAKEQCECLIVGVATDAIATTKIEKIFIPFKERIEIIKSIKYVDKAVSQDSIDKLDEWRKYKFDVVFVGSDWKGTEKWNGFEEKLIPLGVKIVYFPYTKDTSSTQLRKGLLELNNR